MYLVRQELGGPLQGWEVDGEEVRDSCAHRSEPRIQPRTSRSWAFGAAVERLEKPGEHYPMLCRPGFAAIGRDITEAMWLLERANGK